MTVKSFVDKTRYRTSLVASFGYDIRPTMDPNVFQVFKVETKAGTTRSAIAGTVHRREFISFLRQHGHIVEIKERDPYDFSHDF